MKEKLGVAVNWFVPEDIKNDTLQYSKAKNIIAISAIMALAALIYSVLYFALDHMIGGYILLSGALVACVVPFVIRKYNCTTLPANVSVGAMFYTLAGLCYMTDGILAPNSMWFVAIPVVGVFTGGILAGVVWGCLAVIFELFLYFLELTNYNFPSHPLSVDTLKFMQAVANWGLILFMLWFAMAYETIKEEMFKEISFKNMQMEQQKKKIIQSITYAEKIQNSVLPRQSFLNRFFEESFVIYKPRDIVSGDFYWFSDVDNCVVVVCADCTGHGVPGGLMSMLGVSHLNEIVNHQKIIEPAEILESLRKKIKESLHQTGNRDEQKDGLDMSVCVFNPQSCQVKFAGANNAVFLVHNGQLEEFKPTRNPIGVHSKEVSFTQETISVEKWDQVFMFTDGYVDQFGGEKNRQFSKTGLKNKIMQYCNMPMNEQKTRLEADLSDWMKDHDQLDDITLIGIRV